MGKQILLLRLEGVWQSWGIRSRWDVRDTGTEPTKSGIVGLLGCALGYPMRDPRLENKLDAGLLFGVRVENPGKVVRDYQTITGFLPTAGGTYKHSGSLSGKSLAKILNDPEATPVTVVSPRFYLEDASFLVALEEKPGFEGLLVECESALKNPKWPVYLGRKACIPTRPVLESLTSDYDDIEDALHHHVWSYLGASAENRIMVPPKQLTAYVESTDGQHVRRDAVRSNQARTFGTSRIKSFTVKFPERSNGDVSEQT